MGSEAINLLRSALKDPEALAHNIALLGEELGKAASAFLRPREEGKLRFEPAGLNEAVKSLAAVGRYWLEDSERVAEAQRRLWAGYVEVWSQSLKRSLGAPAPPAAEAEPGDKRFGDPQWSSVPYFDFLKQAYLITSRWAEGLIKDAADIDEHTRQKAAFYLRQMVAALSPSNFVLTNPELLRETLASNAENLVRGARMLAEDIVAGGGDLKVRQSSPGDFEVGRNLATTPGKVVWQNDICQLIQYQASTKTVFKRPLLIVPPWINKFYILDLNPEKSFIRWCVEQGHTVFVISWVNPDERHAHKSFENYMREGVIEALDAIEKSTGAKQVDSIGYCVGGTLLAVTLAYLAAKSDERIGSATFFAAQVDFARPGDLSVFVDEEQIAATEKAMNTLGYLEGKRMMGAFNMLRPNDLIWPYFVKTYLLGKEPQPFDILFWNTDATRMPAANHSFYLRNCYLENRLAKGAMTVAGERLDLRKVKIPIYNLALRDDHIAPANSVLAGSTRFSSKVRNVIAGSGHIAGVINPPAKNKYSYWTDGPKRAKAAEAWLAKAKEHKGSWWNDWQDWVSALEPARVKARAIGGGKLKPIEDAPGSYVKVKG